MLEGTGQIDKRIHVYSGNVFSSLLRESALTLILPYIDIDTSVMSIDNK